jgi:hypothetical protein
MGKSKNFVIPESDIEFLSDMLKTLKKRSKSLKYNCWNISIEKVFECFNDGKFEKIEIKIQPSDINAELKIDIWEDRLVHLVCWEHTKVQKWDWEYDGRLLPTYGSKDILLALEETRFKFFQMSESKKNEFESSWSHLLANGLKSVQ